MWSGEGVEEEKHHDITEYGNVRDKINDNEIIMNLMNLMMMMMVMLVVMMIMMMMMTSMNTT